MEAASLFFPIMMSKNASWTSKKNADSDLILSIWNWLDGCSLLFLWCHMSDRLPHPNASKVVIWEERDAKFFD